MLFRSFVTIDPNEYNKYVHHWSGRQLTSIEWRIECDLSLFFKDMLKDDKLRMGR